jgi:hypothetical protein
MGGAQRQGHSGKWSGVALGRSLSISLPKHAECLWQSPIGRFVGGLFSLRPVELI